MGAEADATRCVIQGVQFNSVITCISASFRSSLVTQPATMSDTTIPNTSAPVPASTVAPAPATALDPVASDAPAIPASFQKFINQAENVRSLPFFLGVRTDGLGILVHAQGGRDRKTVH